VRRCKELSQFHGENQFFFNSHNSQPVSSFSRYCRFDFDIFTKQQQLPLARKKHYILRLYTKKYLRVYLEKLYGSPIVFATTNYFGISLAGLLQNPLEFHDKKEYLRLRVDKLDEQIEIHIPHSFVKNRSRKGFDVEESHQISIMKLFEEKFEDHLYEYCLAHCSAGKQKSEVIREFCNRYGIKIGEEADDHVTMDALVKKEYRKKKEIEKIKEAAPDLSTVKPLFRQTALFFS
jgi:hypothetical protein